MRKLIVLLAILILFLGFWSVLFPSVSKLTQDLSKKSPVPAEEKVKIVTEESVVTDIVDNVGPAVVTVGVEQKVLQINPFDPFGIFRTPGNQGKQQEQNIGSGFIVDAGGLIVTNKHVVSSAGKYKVITSDGKKYDVAKIYRDPTNDIAILKINPPSDGLKTVELGDSGKLKVGQFVVAIGTALGEFRNTVTTGVISGLGRGITAGNPFEGYVERLDDVIQTDAAINPGNSGGPLVNSSRQVIGINTAVASGAQNVGFAIPINVVRDSLKNFNETGQFSRAYLGVAYRIVSRDLAILNEVPEGAYVQEVIDGGPADKAGIKVGDILTKIDGQKITDKDGGLAAVISKKKVGETVKINLWRDGKALEVTATLQEAPGE